MLSRSLGIISGIDGTEVADFPRIPLYREDGEANTDSVAARVALEGVPVNIPNVERTTHYSTSHTRAFDERIRRMLGREDETLAYVFEPKLDGAGVELIYEGGRFVQGLTRGDGQTGEDVSASLRHVLSVPLALAEGGPAAPAVASVRGEIERD